MPQDPARRAAKLSFCCLAAQVVCAGAGWALVGLTYATLPRFALICLIAATILGVLLLRHALRFRRTAVGLG